MDSEIWAFMVHLGCNCWADHKVDHWGDSVGIQAESHSPEDYLRFDEEEWQFLTSRIAAMGGNMILLDLAEGLQYESHPELSAKGAWSKERLETEIRRLAEKGIELIPKLNFSTGHDTWLKEYHRMVSTPKYYQVCEDLIKDVAEMFDHPRFFHLGYDEETANHQSQHLFAVCRQGELWWHDFLWFAKITEKTGCRPWIWSDYVWHHKDEFLARMPKSVLQSNWYYGSNFDVENMGDRAKYVAAYEWLDKAGFDQVPTGSNFSSDVNFAGTVKFCDAHCRPELLKGYMMAPWTRTFAIHEEKSMQAIAQMAAVIKNRG